MSQTQLDDQRTPDQTFDNALRGGLDSPADDPAKSHAVSELEMVRWHVANGGSYSDSTGQVRARYAEDGPRRKELPPDPEDHQRTRDQRTW
jgi:hypothetical protein